MQKSIGNMKSLAEIMSIIENTYSYIPLLQRNYKWSMECASELAEDLWNVYKKCSDKSYQLNMITIYNNKKENSLQILDGQQRLITLKLLLAYLEPKDINLNYAFERDFRIDERHGRRYFIDHYLKAFDIVMDKSLEKSVDIKRLYDNFISMIIPISFRSVVSFYRECLEKEKNQIEKKYTAYNFFVGNEENPGINDVISNLLANKINDLSKENLDCFRFSQEEIGYDKGRSGIYSWCVDFQTPFLKSSDDDNISDDEILISEYSNKFQKLWSKKIIKYIKEKGIYNVLSEEDRKEFATYIKNNVKMLYHETESQPINEFLNINENKTRFVISDYIRANMISDNPIDGESLSEEEKSKNQENRKDILNVFSNLSKYLYSKKYNKLWELVKTRYDDFEHNPDINRLKVVFCDKYIGTSTEGYEYSSEMKRLQYLQEMLRTLAIEIGIDDENKSEEVWNTYNAVYMLLECKEKYRFFNLFTNEDIEKNTALNDVTTRERFSFFELAYTLAEKSDDIWDISYFLESQLCVGKCEIKKLKNLPKCENNNTNIVVDQWCYVNRGTNEDDLYKCISDIVEKVGASVQKQVGGKDDGSMDMLKK